jgi:hypothetical protein
MRSLSFNITQVCFFVLQALLLSLFSLDVRQTRHSNHAESLLRPMQVWPAQQHDLASCMSGFALHALVTRWGALCTTATSPTTSLRSSEYASERKTQRCCKQPSFCLLIDACAILTRLIVFKIIPYLLFALRAKDVQHPRPSSQSDITTGMLAICSLKRSLCAPSGAYPSFNWNGEFEEQISISALTIILLGSSKGEAVQVCLGSTGRSLSTAGPLKG